MAGDWTRHVIVWLEVEVVEPLRRFEAGYLWIQVLKGLSEPGFSKYEMVRTGFGYSTVALILGCWRLGPC